MANNLDLVHVCEMVLTAKRQGKEAFTVNGVTFDDLQWHANDGGRCQENTRKAIEAATGKPMPGKACCAYQTNLNLYALSQKRGSGVTEVVPAGGRIEDAQPGDILMFRGGPYHSAAARRAGACGNRVGHVGIWLGNGRMFQHTSRAGLAITDAGPTADQRKRFCGAYRLLPLAAAKPKKQMVKIIDHGTGAVIAEYEMVPRGDHIADQGKVYVVVK